MSAAGQPGYTPAPLSGNQPEDIKRAASARWVRNIAEVVNNILRGKVNAVLPLTLDANSATTTVLDARISAYSALVLQPVTSNAAAALYDTPYIIPSGQKSGEVVLNHANDANADKTYNLVIIG